MLEVLDITLEIAAVPEVPELFSDAAIWMDDFFFFLFFFWQHMKHLEKPSRKDLKNKVTVEL